MKRVLVVLALVSLPGLACAGSADAMVVKEVRRIENDPNRQVKVARRKGELLPGLWLYDARVLIPDHPGHRCAVRGQAVWCDDAMLPAIVKAYALGARPKQLTDAQWIELTGFTVHTEPLTTPGKARLLEGYAPAAAKAQIVPPAVTRAADGVRVTYFVERVVHQSFPSGPKALLRLEVRIAGNDVATIVTTPVWEGN